tara:strand:- start:1594 stop:2022 length:429 start_codon:yes stop_codon:yes gene_type:complete
MTKINIEQLNLAVENIKNDNILNTTLSEIYNVKNRVLLQLQLDTNKIKKFHKCLEKYRYVDEITELNSGDYVRWIDLTNASNIKLTNGAFICDVEINSDGVHIKLKTFKNRYIQLRMDEIFIFQKIGDSELVVLSALKYLEK